MTYSSQFIVTVKLTLLIVLLKTHGLDIVPNAHNCLSTRSLRSIQNISQNRAQLESLGILVASEMDSNIHIFITSTLELQLVEICSIWETRRIGRNSWLLPLDTVICALFLPTPVVLDRHGLEKVREFVLLAFRLSFHLLLLAVFVHWVALRVFILVFTVVAIAVCLFWLFVQQSSLDLDSVRGIHIRAEVESIR